MAAESISGFNVKLGGFHFPEYIHVYTKFCILTLSEYCKIQLKEEKCSGKLVDSSN